MKSKHTSGQWHAKEYHGITDIRTDAHTINGMTICSINEDMEEAEANAKLIAAAPELLEALKMFVVSEQFRQMVKKSNGEFDTAFKAAEAAIKKATT